MKNQKGLALIEAVLLAAVIVVLSILFCFVYKKYFI